MNARRERQEHDRDALKQRFLETTAPEGYSAQGVDPTGLNDPDGEVKAVYKHREDGRELRFPVDALMAGFTPDNDFGCLERALHERPDIAKRALEHGKGARALVDHVEDRWDREMTTSKVREFAGELDDLDGFLQGCLRHPDEDREFTEDELAKMREEA